MTRALQSGLRAMTLATVCSILAVAAPVIAADEKKSRVGSCSEAKSQSRYWCEERAKVTVISFGMECENAKKNVKEACEGIKSEDKAYQFPSPNKAK